MRKLFMLGAILAAVVFPVASQAQAAPSKFQLGLRLGYAPSMGDAFKFKADGTSAKMSDGMKSQIPIQLDAMYKVTPEVAVGAYFSYGFGQGGPTLVGPDNVCDISSVDCSASSYRLGLQGTYAFTKVSPTFVPWAGVGIGYEWASAKAEEGGAKLEESLSGFEFLNLQVGGDWKVNPKFSVGPYLMYSLGQYSGGEETISGFGSIGLPDQTVKFKDFADTTMHQWFSFGLAGKFDL